METPRGTSVILKWSKRIRWALMLVVLGYLLVCGYMWATQRQYIFLPKPKLQTSPERFGMKFEEIHIPSGSGDERGELYAWWIPADRSDAPNVLYLHGNDKNIGHSHDMDSVTRLHDMGYNLLAIDYRGYGQSTGGEPSETKVYEDAEAAWQHLIKQRGCDPKHSFIYGHSLGGAIAIELASHHPEAAGIITESTFTSMADIGKMQYAYLPIDLLLNQHFDSLDKVSHLKIPLLLIHGTWDKLVPYPMSQRLYDRASQPKFIKLIEGGEHNNSGLISPVEYRAAISEFIQHYAKGRP